jgi:polyhydroxyalkanoate synthase
MGLVVGRTAARTTVPTIIDFLRTRSEPVGADSTIARTAEGVGR